MSKLFCAVMALFLVTVGCTGVFERRNRQGKGEDFCEAAWGVLKIGASKVLSSIGVVLLTAFFSAMLLSWIIKPEPMEVMPAFYYDGTYAEYNSQGVDEGAIEAILREAQTRMNRDPKEAHYDMAYAYFVSSNYDLAAEHLEVCYELEADWRYAYDLGVTYGYLRDYQTSLKYLEKALELDPPPSDRGTILETITMLDNYFGQWISSLFK